MDIDSIPTELLLNILLMSDNICCFLVCWKWNNVIVDYNKICDRSDKISPTINADTDPKLIRWFVENYRYIPDHIFYYILSQYNYTCFSLIKDKLPHDFAETIVSHNTLENIVPKLTWAKNNGFQLTSKLYNHNKFIDDRSYVYLWEFLLDIQCQFTYTELEMFVSYAPFIIREQIILPHLYNTIINYRCLKLSFSNMPKIV